MIDVIIDGQWGSTGKGKLAGYLAWKRNYAYAVTDAMPNAGHTCEIDGKKFVFHHLCVASLFGANTLIGPHAAINLNYLFREIEMVKQHRGTEPEVIIHPLTPVIDAKDLEDEGSIVRGIAGTGQGGCSAHVRRMLRDGSARLAGEDAVLRGRIGDTREILVHAYEKGPNHRILLEGSQGFDLGISHGMRYPYVTSRDCLVGRMLDNAGIPVRWGVNVIGSVRTFPIRVGNTESTSGPCYDDQHEMLWKDIGVEAELTTVTKRVRRVFSFSYDQFTRFLKFVRPNDLFLNFVNYLHPHHQAEFMEGLIVIAERYHCKLRFVGTGADLREMEEL